MEQDKSRKTFQIDAVDDTGVRRVGTFTVKKLSIRDRAKIATKRSQLGDGMYCVRDDKGDPTGRGIDEDSDMLNSMIAYLEVSLIQKPDWWNLDVLGDLDLARKVYGEAMDFEMTFFRSRNQQVDNGSGSVRTGNSSSANSSPNTGTQPAPVVDPQVSAALD